VIPNHFILATKTAKAQTDVLEEDDLEMTYACLQSWAEGTSPESPRRLFAFFNSGDHSGASQAHRHLQFLPFEDMAGQSDKEHWRLLLDSMNQALEGDEKSGFLSNLSLPFRHFALPIPPQPTSTSLHHLYLSLYCQAVDYVHRFRGVAPEPSQGDDPRSPPGAAISYNLAMTVDAMAICPRRSESTSLPLAATNNEIDINGTILGGTLMVKDEEQWDTLKQEHGILDEVLGQIGFPVNSNI